MNSVVFTLKSQYHYELMNFNIYKDGYINIDAYT